MLGRKISVNGYASTGSVVALWEVNGATVVVACHEVAGKVLFPDILSSLMKVSDCKLQVVEDYEKYTHLPKLVHPIESITFLDKIVPNTSLFRKLYPVHDKIKGNLLRVMI